MELDGGRVLLDGRGSQGEHALGRTFVWSLCVMVCSSLLTMRTGC